MLLTERDPEERSLEQRKRAIVNKLRERWQYARSHQQDPAQFALAARLAKRIRRLTYLWSV